MSEKLVSQSLAATEERERKSGKGVKTREREREGERDRKGEQTEGKKERGSVDVNKDESRFDEPLFCPRRVGATSSSVHKGKKNKKEIKKKLEGCLF